MHLINKHVKELDEADALALQVIAQHKMENPSEPEATEEMGMWFQ